MRRAAPSNLLHVAGLVTWTVAGLPTLSAICREPSARSAGVWLMAYVAFALLFTVLIRGHVDRASSMRLLLGGEVVAALACVALGRGALTATLLVAVAGQAPRIFGERAAILLVAAQSLALAVLERSRGGTMDAAVTVMSYVGFQLFALGAALVVERESQARRELARIHAELVATQALFADSTRGAERIRIARELHDLLGHHLTALSLSLQVARHSPHGAHAELDRAQDITRQLLGEVRGVVGALREDHDVDLNKALRMLVAGIPEPRIHLALPEYTIGDAAVAHIVLTRRHGARRGGGAPHRADVRARRVARRAHPARARGAALDGQRVEQPRDRARARRGRRDHQEPRLRHPRQARGP